jgi:glycosyltransferase involved in cell wall biosynthesis
VVPAYNEATQIGRVIETMPDYVDKVVIVNDASRDATRETVERYQRSHPRIILINHERNQGVGRAIATGYTWVLAETDCAAAVVMAGDAQMDPTDLPRLLDPVVAGEVDYSKGNRLFTGEAYSIIPKLRYFGNSVLSLLTKIASGYWHIADSQSGYTVISRRALATIDWDKMYARYGQPNDLLVRLNVFDFKVRDVHIKPVYNVGEKSGIRIHQVLFTISWLLLKLFLWRLKEKYVIRNFHPLVFFYLLGLIFGVATAGLSVRMFFYWAVDGRIPPINALAAMFSFMSASLFTLFAMWFDMETNKDLK